MATAPSDAIDHDSSAMATAPSDAVAGQPLTEFHCFPNLPAELQAAVWQAALPRIWGYQFLFNRTASGLALFQPSRTVVNDTAPHRTLLATCRGSRQEVLLSFHLLPIRAEKESEDGKSKIKIIHILFDKKFGIFCINLSHAFDGGYRGRPWEAGLERFTQVANEDLAPSELRFREWVDTAFWLKAAGLRFSGMIQRVALVVNLPQPDDESNREDSDGDDVDFLLWRSDNWFIMFSWALLSAFQPLEEVYFTHADAMFHRLSPDLSLWMTSIDIPKFCTDRRGEPDSEDNILDEINEFSSARKIYALEMGAVRLGLDEAVICEEDVGSFEELYEMAAAMDDEGSDEGNDEPEDKEAS